MTTVATIKAGNYTNLGGASSSAASNASDIASASALASLDVTDPTAILAFFQTQMDQSQGSLNSLMEDQDQKNKKQEAIQNLAAQFTQYETSGVKPGDSKWDDFVNTAQQLKPLLQDGSDASNAINKILDSATAPYVSNEIIQGQANYDAVKAAHPGAQFQAVPMMGQEWSVMIPDKQSGISADDMKSVDTQLKSLTDGMQSDTSMQMIRIQQQVDQCSQILSLCSNVMKKINDSQDNAVENIK